MSHRDGLEPGARPEALQDVAHVVANRLAAQEEALRDLLGGRTRGELRQDLPLARRERRTACWFPFALGGVVAGRARAGTARPNIPTT